MRASRYHMITRLVVIAGVVAALPLAAGFLLIEHSAKTRLSDAAGNSFFWYAETAASSFDNAVLRELELVGSMARSEATRMALRGASGENDAPTSALGIIARSSKLYRDIALLDTDGNVIGSEEAPSWSGRAQQAAKALRRPRAVEAFVSVDEDTGTLALFRPVHGPEHGELMGFVRAELDTERLFDAITSFRVGETGHACLFERDSGRLLAGRRADCGEGKFARHAELTNAERERARYFLAGASGPASFDRGEGWIVAYARPELSRALPEIEWVVAVEQSLAEAQEPLASLSTELLTTFLGMGLLVLALAAYMSYKLERPLADTSVDLHADPALSPREV